MIFNSLIKFAEENRLKILKVTIREGEGEYFGSCIALKESGFPETFHYDKRSFSWK